MRLALAAVIVALLAPAVPASLHAQEGDISAPDLRIPYADFKKLYDAHKIIVVDTRDAASFAMGHIPGARLIPADDIANYATELKRAKKPVVTYCS